MNLGVEVKKKPFICVLQASKFELALYATDEELMLKSKNKKSNKMKYSVLSKKNFKSFFVILITGMDGEDCHVLRFLRQSRSKLLCCRALQLAPGIPSDVTGHPSLQFNHHGKIVSTCLYIPYFACSCTSNIRWTNTYSVVFRSTMQSFRENLEDQNEKHQYCNRVFGGWDFALSEEGTAVLKHRSLYKDLAVSVLT